MPVVLVVTKRRERNDGVRCARIDIEWGDMNEIIVDADESKASYRDKQ